MDRKRRAGVERVFRPTGGSTALPDSQVAECEEHLPEAARKTTRKSLKLLSTGTAKYMQLLTTVPLLGQAWAVVHRVCIAHPPD